jgi:biopolymer transport protein TolQ
VWFKIIPKMAGLFAPAALAGAAAGVSSPESDLSILPLIWTAGPVVKAVMLILLAFSVVSWAIIIAKFRQLNRTQRENATFLANFWQAPDLAAAALATRDLPLSPAAAIFRRSYPPASQGDDNPGAGTEAPPGGQASRALRQALQEQVQRLSASLTFLATCGNTSPFIGLFGTVWGIMTSFHNIGLKGSASLATVAPGIAEALIATAAGLAAAIPAVVAYNYFLGRVRRLEAELTAFAGDLVQVLESTHGSAARR